MTTKNLLRESILQVELLKQASAQATKDSILQKLAEDVKRRLRQQDEEQQEVQDEDPIEVPEEEQCEETQQLSEQDEDVDNSTLQDIDAQIEEALNDIDLDQEQDEMIDMTEDQDFEMEEDLDRWALPEGQDEDAKLQAEIQEQLLDAEIQEQLNNSGLGDELDNQIPDQEQTIQQEVDEELFEKIKGLINNQIEQDEAAEEEQVVAQFKKRVKKLTSENKKYKSALGKIKQDLYETRMLNLKGKLLVSLFSKFDLTKKQQMKIIEKLDTVDSQKNIKLMYTRLVQGLRQNKSIVKKHKPNLISDTMKSTKSNNNKNTKTGKDLDESLAPIRDIFRRKVGILN